MRAEVLDAHPQGFEQLPIKALREVNRSANHRINICLGILAAVFDDADSDNDDEDNDDDDDTYYED